MSDHWAAQYCRIHWILPDLDPRATYMLPHAIPARRRKPAAMRSSRARSA